MQIEGFHYNNDNDLHFTITEGYVNRSIQSKWLASDCSIKKQKKKRYTIVTAA
jgi:hypothetical protein